MTKPRIAFFGLGLMGSGMARRLIGAGFPLIVFNRSRDKAIAFANDGASVADSPRAAAAQADVVISMVADDPASRAMWLGESGALNGAPRGALLIEASTLTVGWVNELATAAAERGLEFLDAPVTGSKIHAASGELNFLVGGSVAALERARPVLAVMSKSITHVGPAGSGALLKLINNFLCGVQAASLAEALALIETSELDKTKALDILTNGTPGSPLMRIITPRMTAADFTPNFLLRLMAKDLTYSLQEGERRGMRLAMVGSALEVFKQAMAQGFGEKDFSAVAELVRGGKGREG
jgi:3-hydroxyisobutyrate dehydrogenase